MIMKTYIPFFILCILIFCSTPYQKKISLEQALSFAGENRIELEKVFEHYKNDSLKLKAAEYLITNMPLHFSRVEYYLSPEGKQYIPDIACFPDKEAVKKHCDSLRNKGYTIQGNNIYDSKTLKSDFLIRNIDLAFQVREKPWAKDIPFEDFCRYILPYRTQVEPVSNMRREFMEKYLPLIDSGKVNNAFDACKIINSQLMKELVYKDTGSPLYPTVESTYHSGRGSCEDLCNLATLLMRAVGIPVAVQLTTWTKMDLAHSWGVVLHDGKFYNFSPVYGQPDTYREKLETTGYLKPAKVYRLLFDPEFKETDVKDDGYITNLKSPLLRDVTKEEGYQVLDICIETDKPVSSSIKQIYLCTYNDYDWKPLAIGNRQGSTCRIKDIVGNNIFIIAEASNTQYLHYITAPFILKKDGSIHKLIPQKEFSQSFTFDKRKNKLNQKHTLHYWDTNKNGFISLKEKSSTDTTQTYNQIPKNALLWFTIPERIVNQRVFYIENDSIKY